MSDPSITGTFINEQDVAELVGVSRTPVREALLMLSAQHLVQLVPHRGAFVPSLTPAQVAQVLETRQMIEQWCAREAIAKGRVPIEEMTSYLEQQQAVVRGASLTFIERDRDFHSVLVAATGNEVLMDMYEALRVRHVLIGVAAVERPGASSEDVLTEHEAILLALKAGDADAANDAIAEHLAATHRRLVLQ